MFGRSVSVFAAEAGAQFGCALHLQAASWTAPSYPQACGWSLSCLPQLWSLCYLTQMRVMALSPSRRSPWLRLRWALSHMLLLQSLGRCWRCAVAALAGLVSWMVPVWLCCLSLRAAT